MIWIIVLSFIIIAKADEVLNNWAVLVCSSRYWFNYRHLTNVLSVYRKIKKFGIADDHIILMNAMETPCDPRNPYPGTQFNSNSRQINLYDGEIEIDYSGSDVNAESFLRVLTGRYYEGTPLSKRLESDANSSILLFLSGHGGDEFLKFHDSEELLSQDLENALQEMDLKRRYKEILLLVDTCQASTLSHRITAPRVTTISSSSKGENSYAYQSSKEMGVAVIDRFTYATMKFFENNNVSVNGMSRSSLTVGHYFSSLDSRFLYSTSAVSQTADTRQLHDIALHNFFGASRDVCVVNIINTDATTDASREATLAFSDYFDSYCNNSL